MTIKISQEPLPLEYVEPPRTPNGWVALAWYAPGNYWKTAGTHSSNGFHRSLSDAKSALAGLGDSWVHRQIFKIGEPQR